MYLINGQEVDSLTIRDRAIHYGDGVFETLAVKEEVPLAWSRHLQRLQLGCETLGFSCPPDSLLRDESLRLCRNTERGVLKWIISRGEGGRGYQSPECPSPTRILAIYEWPDYPEAISTQGVNIGICSGRLAHQPMLAGIKHLNRLEQVLLRDEVVKQGNPEGIVLDMEDKVIEGSMSNIFMVKNGDLMTPSLVRCGVAGIVRGAILDISPDWGTTAQVKDIALDELLQADEIFFCNSIIGIWPVGTIDNCSFSIGPHSLEIREKLIAADLIADG